MADPTPEEAAAQAQYTRGPADTTGTQLPKGQASSVNTQDQQAQQAIAQDAVPTVATGTPQQTAPPAGTRPFTAPTQLPGEEDNLLLGPTSRPNEHVATGVMGNTTPPPTQTATWLSALRQASQDPEAPARVRELTRLVNALLSRTNGGS